MKKLGSRLTYANVMSSLAVFLVLGGATAFATSQIHLGKNSVGSKQLKRNAVTSTKIKNNAITANKIKKNAVIGSKIDLSTLGAVPQASSLTGFTRKGITKVSATNGATEAAAREAAPEVPLFSAGALSFYAKCFSFGTTVKAEVFIKTSTSGAIFYGETDELDGSPSFLNTGTPETEREVAWESTGTNSSTELAAEDTLFYAMAPDGSAAVGQVSPVAKNGGLPEGDGVYGPGNICLFAGQLTQLN